ncbi:hypothetical protein F385_1964 [Pantoea agglomerans 299R]|nr:hypothetical protein F385_1964 [Pantoea agglomerans 299R]
MTFSELSREYNCAASDEPLAILRNVLNDDDVKPLSDFVNVQSA